MSNQHDPENSRSSKNTRLSKTQPNVAQNKHLRALQWDLDQELQDHVERVKHIMSSHPVMSNDLQSQEPKLCQATDQISQAQNTDYVNPSEANLNKLYSPDALHNSNSPLTTPYSRLVGSNIITDRPTDLPTNRPTNPPTPLPSSLPSSLTSQSAAKLDPETMENITAWLEKYHIGSINFLLRHYSADCLGEAADDFEKAIEGGLKVKNPTAFFRSLLK